MTIYFGSQECEKFRPLAEMERAEQGPDGRSEPPWLKNLAFVLFCRSRQQYILE